MMDYCAREATCEPNEMICEREMPTAEILQNVRKELAETFAILSQIKISVDGEPLTDRKIDEPKCMHDEAKIIEQISMDCMGLAHCIHAKLFRTDGR